MKPMLSKRQRQVSRNLHRVMGQILIENGKSWFGNKIVTLTNVYVTTDLGLARFYLSLGSFEEPHAMIKDFNAQSSAIKKLLTQKIGKQMRRIPDVAFFLDESLDEMNRMDDIFNAL